MRPPQVGREAQHLPVSRRHRKTSPLRRVKYAGAIEGPEEVPQGLVH
jgi:hypothetical protein